MIRDFVYRVCVAAGLAGCVVLGCSSKDGGGSAYSKSQDNEGYITVQVAKRLGGEVMEGVFADLQKAASEFPELEGIDASRIESWEGRDQRPGRIELRMEKGFEIIRTRPDEAGRVPQVSEYKVVRPGGIRLAVWADDHFMKDSVNESISIGRLYNENVYSIRYYLETNPENLLLKQKISSVISKRLEKVMGRDFGVTLRQAKIVDGKTELPVMMEIRNNTDKTVHLLLSSNDRENVHLELWGSILQAKASPTDVAGKEVDVKIEPGGSHFEKIDLTHWNEFPGVSTVYEWKWDVNLKYYIEGEKKGSGRTIKKNGKLGVVTQGE